MNSKMILLSFRTVGKQGRTQIGLLGDLTIERDLDIIQDIAVTHFNQHLVAEDSTRNLDNAVILIKESSRLTFSVTLRPFGKQTYTRIYLMDEIPVLNDLIVPHAPQVQPVVKDESPVDLNAEEYRAVRMIWNKQSAMWTVAYIETLMYWDTNLDRVKADMSRLIARWYNEHTKTSIYESVRWNEDDFANNLLDFDGDFIEGECIQPNHGDKVFFAIERREHI